MSILEDIKPKEVKKPKKTAQDKAFVTNSINDKIEDLRTEIRGKYLRVGVSYFKRVERQMKNRGGAITQDLVKWNLDTISHDYDAELHEINKIATLTKGVRFVKIPDLVPKYDDFCNEPSNTDYQQVVLGQYNLYNQLTHKLLPCKDIENPIEFETILLFLSHIFGKQISIIMDYLTILYRYPNHILPVICLVSGENQTGKSTFLELLKAMWQENAVIVGNEDFKAEFNSHYISKNLIMIDESKVSLEKEKEKERIKYLATAPTAQLQFKGVDRKEIAYCGKLIMTSNFVDNFMKINSNDARFWVIKVNTITTKTPNFKEKLFAEIPYFLYYIANREITHPDSGERHWFDSELLVTDARKNIIEKTKNMYEIILDEYFTEIACNIENITTEIKVSPSDIQNENKVNAKWLTTQNIKEYLAKKAIKPTGKTENYILYSYQNNTNMAYKKTGRPYTLLCEDFLPKTDVQNNQNPAKAEEILPF